MTGDLRLRRRHPAARALERNLRARVPPGVKTAIRRGEGVWTRATAGLRDLPDFLILGAQRAGTTSLYKYLVEHPAIAAPPLGKGAHFFDTDFHRGPDWYRGHFPTRIRKQYVRARSRTRAVTGEGSPYYLFHPLVPARVAGLLPGAKLIALLRDPVERAYSQHQHERARGFEHLSFEEAIEREPERLAGEVERMEADNSYRSFSHQHHSYLARGLYAEQLERWYQHFPREQVLVLPSEDFFADPDRVYRVVLGFLGVPSLSLGEYETFNPRDYADMGEAMRRRLREHFREPNERLYALLGRDLGWPR